MATVGEEEADREWAAGREGEERAALDVVEDEFVPCTNRQR